jgi:WD40 repeat protein
MSTRSFFQRIAGALFGYDFFIAYAWKDGREYAAELRRQLEAKRFECFLDSENYVAGDDWKEIGAWSLARTSYLILVASPAALESGPVVREVQLFKGTGKRIFAIDFEGSLSVDGAGSSVARLLGESMLRLLDDTRAALEKGHIAPDVIERLDVQFDRARQETKRLRWVSAVAAVLAILAIIAVISAVRTTRALDDVRRAGVRAEVGRRASEAQRLMAQLPQQGALLAIGAVELAKDSGEPLPPSARTALYATLNNLSGERLAADVRWFGMSPDGQWLVAVTSEAGSLSLWRLGADAVPVCAGILLNAGESIRTAAFTPDGRTLVLGGTKGTVAKAALGGGCPSFVPMLRRPNVIDHLELSPDGRWLLAFDTATGNDGEWVLVQWPEMAKVIPWRGRVFPPLQAYFDPSSRRVVTRTEEDALCVHDLSEPRGDCSRRLALAGHGEEYATFDPTGRRLAVTALNTVAIWDFESSATPEPDCTYSTTTSASALVFSSTGRVLYGGDRDSVQAWDFAQAKCPSAMSFGIDEEGLTDAAPLGRAGMIGSVWGGQLITWDALRRQSSVRATDSALVREVSIPQRQDFVVTRGQEWHIELWPIRNELLTDPRMVLRAFDGEMRDLKLSGDGRWLAAVTDLGELRAWSLEHHPTGQPESVRLVSGPLGSSDCFAASATCMAATASGTLRRWDLSATRGPEPRTIPTKLQAGGGVWLSPSGRWLVGYDDADSSVDLVDLQSGAPPKPLFVSPRVIQSIEFSPDETSIVIADGLHEIVVWSTTGVPVDLRPPPEALKLWSVAYAPKGDLHVVLWNARTDLLQVRAGGRTIFQEEVQLPAQAWVIGDRYLLVQATEGERIRKVWVRPITRDGDAVAIGGKVLERTDAVVSVVSDAGGAVVLADAQRKRFSLLDLFSAIPSLVMLPLPTDHDPRQLDATNQWLVALGPPVKTGDVTVGNSVVLLHGGAGGWKQVGPIAADHNVNEAVISPDGHWLATAGTDGVVRLYELDPGQALTAVDVFSHREWVVKLFFDPSSRYLFSLHNDGLLHRADVDMDALVARLRQRVGRELTAAEQP